MRTIRKTLAEINEQWERGTNFDGSKFKAFDDLLAKAIQEADLPRVEKLCDRYKASVMRDIQAGRKENENRQGVLF